MKSPDNPTAPSLLHSAGLVGIATMSSRILGLVRDQVFAYFFGAGNAMDAFNVAFRIPNLVRDLFAEGAMNAAFVPTFTRTLTREGKEAAWRLGNNVLNGLVLVTSAIVICGVIFAWPLVTLFAAEYGQVEGKLELTVRLTQIMFPFLTLVAMAVACMGMLNSLHRFFIPALSPAMFNVGNIVCVVVLVPVMRRMGFQPVSAIAMGVLVGGLGQVLVQWPLLRREGFRYRPILDPRDEGLRQILILMVPGTIGLAAVQINLFVNTVLATGEGTGAVSWLNYAFRIMYLPIGLMGVSVATASLPAISRDAARDDLVAMRGTISRALRLVLVLNVPATFGLMALAGPIVALLFERGNFTPDDTAATASALWCYSPGLMGYCAVKIAAPSFYALRDSKTPVCVSFLTVLVNIALNVILVGWLSFRGLALGTGLAALVNAGILLSLLGRRLRGLEGRSIAISFFKILPASVLMAAAAFGTESGLRVILPGTSLAVQLVRVGSAIAAGILVLTGAARALRIEEFNEAVGMVLRRLGRSSAGR